MRRMLFFAIGLLFVGLLVNTSAPGFIDILAPVACWLFDVEGDTVLDSSGNENHGEIIGDLEWVEGRFGSAIALPGSGDSYILVEDSEFLNPEEQLSVTCWANPTGIFNSPRLVSKDGGVGRDWIGFQLNAQWIKFGVWHSGGGRSLLDTKRGCRVNKWQHFAGTFDGSTIIVYLDGKEIGRMSSGSVGILDTEEPLVFGTYRGSLAQEAYYGLLDDVAIFDVALSPSEVKAIMDKGLRKLFIAVDPLDKLAVTWGDIKNR